MVLARGPMPPNVCQYGPLAYHSRVITYKYQPELLNEQEQYTVVKRDRRVDIMVLFQMAATTRV